MAVAGAGYPLIDFPAEPWPLTAYAQLTPERAGDWADWLNRVSAGRQAAALSFLEQAGAPVAGLGDGAEEWLALGAWLYEWFPLAAGPFLSSGRRGDPGWRPGFFRDWREFRMGRAWAASVPSDRGYQPAADVLLHSVAVDLALLVTGCAQAARPDLRWQACPAKQEPSGVVFVTPDAVGSAFPLLVRVKEFLVQSTARPRGCKGSELRHWHTADLHRCLQRAAAGSPLPAEYEAFPGSNEYREGCRYYLVKPPRSAAGPAAELVAAISVFRQAGWFLASKLTDAKLAAAANATWRAHEGEDISPAMSQARWPLLMLDCAKTWSEDVDADARPGDDVHLATLNAITEIGGRALRRLSDANEQWTDPDGDAELHLGEGSQERVLRIPAPGRYLSPALVTGLNALLPAGGGRLWFADNGPPIAIVTWATTAERDTLQRLTGIRLSLDPPSWWTDLAPLQPAGEQPDQQAAPSAEEISDYWDRVPPDEAYLLGVTVESGQRFPGEPFDWLVTVAAREYFRDDPLGPELQRRLEHALLAVPGVTSAENASWETWYVTGQTSGEALCQAAATILDDLADRMRAQYRAMFGEE